MGKLVGIAPRSFVLEENTTNVQDVYHLGNNYTKRVIEVGGTPIGLAPVDNWLTEEALEMCDSFLVQGGAHFFPYHFQIIHHAVTRGKRYLGVCLGQQLIYVYFEIKRRVEELGYEGDLVKAICDYLDAQPADFSVQRRVPNHRCEYPPRGNEDIAKHHVDIVPGTLMRRVLDREKIRICTFHNVSTPHTQNLVPINAWSSDGVVEGTEYADHILGIQGHPEMDSQLNELFRFLV